MPTIKQASSLFIDYELPNFRLIDSTWGNWLAKFEIAATETSTPALVGTLSPSTTEGIFNLRLLSSDTTWTSINTGVYRLMLEFYNDAVGYREERHEKLIIQVQGL